ncbi:testis-expressed protein 47-like [Python bivittatus]|uniref:Testis-expressed protein 47-like n=1 Tax=Python bivittatus TaxID=176946 RepID=A0A9F5IPQ1_PYTBI|nr:testis-expressed protein 47-like [Python bivittatus]
METHWKYLLHRLFFVAMLREEASEGEITGYHEQLFQKISRFHLGEPASGVLLIYSQSILHILEASSGTLYHILKNLALFEKQGTTAHRWFMVLKQLKTKPKKLALLQDIKILVISHNIPTRLFTQWYATKVEVPVTLEDVTQSQTTEEVITECLTLILKLGVYLATLKVGSKGLGECLHTAVPELLIPAETIRYLCRTQECLSPTEFLKVFDNPLQPNMDSGTPPSPQREAPSLLGPLALPSPGSGHQTIGGWQRNFSLLGQALKHRCRWTVTDLSKSPVVLRGLESCRNSMAYSDSYVYMKPYATPDKLPMFLKA